MNVSQETTQETKQHKCIKEIKNGEYYTVFPDNNGKIRPLLVAKDLKEGDFLLVIHNYETNYATLAKNISKDKLDKILKDVIGKHINVQNNSQDVELLVQFTAKANNETTQKSAKKLFNLIKKQIGITVKGKSLDNKYWHIEHTNHLTLDSVSGCNLDADYHRAKRSCRIKFNPPNISGNISNSVHLLARYGEFEMFTLKKEGRLKKRCTSNVCLTIKDSAKDNVDNLNKTIVLT